ARTSNRRRCGGARREWSAAAAARAARGPAASLPRPAGARASRASGVPEQRRISVRERLDEFLLEVRVARLDRRRHPLFIQALRAIDLGAQPMQEIAVLAPGAHRVFGTPPSH